MLLSLLNWIYIFAICYVLGFFFLPRVSRLIDKDANLSFNWSDNIVAGLVIATFYAQTISLFMGVSLAANLILAVTALALVVIDRKKMTAIGNPFKGAKLGVGSIALIIFGIVLFVLNLMFTAESSFHYDTGLYHAQAIHWLEDYGVIKGLGLIHMRFAYNSAYLPLCALFSFRAITGGQSLHCVSGFLSAFVCLYSVYGWLRTALDKDKAGHKIMSSFVRIAPVFYFLICFIELTSPESDYITIYLIIWMFSRLSEIEDSPSRDTALCLFAILSFSLVAYKLSAAVIAVITIWPLYVLIKKKNVKSILVCALFAAANLIPYVIRNIIISGWAIYPVAVIDLFDVPWKLPRGIVESDAAEIAQWARSLNVSGTYSVFGWVLSWWQEQFLATRMFVSSLILSLPVLAYEFFDRKRSFAKFMMAVLFGTIVFYFFKAPLIRYCYGPVLVLPLMIAGYLLEEHRGTLLRTVVVCLVAAAIEAPCVHSVIQLVKFDYEESVARFSPKDHIVNQVDYPVADVAAEDWYGHTVYLPLEGDQCWYSAFPSSPYQEAFDTNMPVSADLSDGVVRIDRGEEDE